MTDYEAIAWAVKKLTAFGVASFTMDNALMMDRLEFMLKFPESAGAQQTDKARGLSQPQRDYCSEKLKPGGCQLHNLHCGYPKCNEPPVHLTVRSQVDRCAWLFKTRKPGQQSEWASIDPDDSTWWPMDQGYTEVTRTPLVEAGEPENILPAKYVGKTYSGPIGMARSLLVAAPEPAEQKASQADSRSNQQGEGRCARALADEELFALLPADIKRSAECHQKRWIEFGRAVEALKSDEGDLGVTLRAADSDSGHLAVASKEAGKTPEDHFRAACIMASALKLVRSYPDFDRDPETGAVPLFGEVIDAALKGEIHPTLQFVGDIRNTYGSEEDGTKFF